MTTASGSGSTCLHPSPGGRVENTSITRDTSTARWARDRPVVELYLNRSFLREV